MIASDASRSETPKGAWDDGADGLYHWHGCQFIAAYLLAVFWLAVAAMIWLG